MIIALILFSFRQTETVSIHMLPERNELKAYRFQLVGSPKGIFAQPDTWLLQVLTSLEAHGNCNLQNLKQAQSVRQPGTG